MPAPIHLNPGDKFGEWAVIGRGAKRRGVRKGGAYWVCRCSCGLLAEMCSQMLREGESRMCRACSTRAKNRANPALKIGETVGTYTVIGEVCPYTYKYPCRCVCGTVSLLQVTQFRTGKGAGCRACRGKGQQCETATSSPAG